MKVDLKKGYSRYSYPVCPIVLAVSLTRARSALDPRLTRA